jgi:hypothetical protein
MKPLQTEASKHGACEATRLTAMSACGRRDSTKTTSGHNH